MKLTWLGQAGIYLEIDGLSVMVDPYLSDSVKKVNPLNWRRVPVKEDLFDITPDVLLFTHDHLDHYDPETAPRFLEKEQKMVVLAPGTCWTKARASGGSHNYVLFDIGTEWTEKGVHFRAVKATHSDANAIGVVITGEGKCIYITGDTLYNKQILQQLPENIDLICLPINGVGNNMNAYDAQRFAVDCGAKQAMPIHWGMFDEMDPGVFTFENTIVPEIYKEIEL